MSVPETKAMPSQPEHDQNRPNTNAIDLRKLADKVYHLMLADIRLERARGVPTSHPKRD
ncbi:MAG: hypothetical protein ABI901_06840 [Roseiflexaceae bacterium]